MNLRRRLLMGKAGVAYEAWDLSFDASEYTYIDTGVYLFTQDNLNKDFEIIIDNLYAPSGQTRIKTMVCAKDNVSSSGFLIRPTGDTETAYKGTIAMKAAYYNHITVRRIGGVLSAIGEVITNPGFAFKNESHEYPLILGCSFDDNGNRTRYITGTIGHIVVRWL